jgi:aconitate hydratase
MKKTLTEKIIESHLVEGKMKKGEEIGIRIDQTLTQDATGTLVYLALESLGIDKIETELSASYVDHNLLQTDFKNADDHRFLQSVAEKYGIYFSRPGNGISHQVHLERFGVAGKTLLGSDSHTSTNGGLGMLAIGSGGLDVVMALAGRPFYLRMPKVLGVRLVGKLPPWVSGKDVILEMLRRFSVKGGVGKVVEYFGTGVENLSATDRGTIANMGAELGATSTVFPSDDNTYKFLQSQKREQVWTEMQADEDAEYDEITEINLSELEPLIACPYSPGNVKKVSEVEGTPVNQVITGSSVNSSFRDLMIVAKAIEGKNTHPRVSFEVNPGSRQVLENVAAQGGLLSLIHGGARVHQSGCLGCIGMGQAPATDTVSLRTFPRNFKGRSGTEDDQVYLCSPETAVAAAIFGEITDPRKLGDYPKIEIPKRYLINDENIIPPKKEHADIEVIYGPNIQPLPQMEALKDDLYVEVILKVEDNITTDDIMPAGNEILPLRSNISAISEYVYKQVDPDFAERAQATGDLAVIGGENYGQGSSREHAAIAPRYLGIRVKIAKSFARIHKDNLINYGIIPLEFLNMEDYDQIQQGDRIEFQGILSAIKNGDKEIAFSCNGREMKAKLDVSDRQRRILIAGGLLNLVKEEYA